MKRILLKLSGEALAGEKKTGFDEETVRKVALQVKELVDDGIQVGIVIGGGNFWRGRSSENIDRTKADQIGMLATVMNLSLIHICKVFDKKQKMSVRNDKKETHIIERDKGQASKPDDEIQKGIEQK